MMQREFRVRIIAFLAVSATVFCSVHAGEPTPAFPGAMGFGMFAKGGRGGEVIYVTNLKDHGEGSLRAAVERGGARTVVFGLSGTIELEGPLVVNNGRITIAGQTAPGDGITLANHQLVIAADEVIIRYLRVRPGDVSGEEVDAVSVTRGRDIIIDHCSVSWGTDETLSVAGSRETLGAPDNVTVQWSIISESLNRSVHSKGAHGFGSLVRSSGGGKISHHYNLWAHHSARMPRPGNYFDVAEDPTGAIMSFTNNVFYDWGGAHSGYNNDENTKIRYDFIGNTYLPGPATEGQVAFRERSRVAVAYFAGNSMDGTTPEDPYRLVAGRLHAEYRAGEPLSVPGLMPVSSQESYEAVMESAGASLVRDSVDRRVLETVRTRSGGLIDSQGDVGGWPALASTRSPEDSDRDGIPDAVEMEWGLDPGDPTDSRRAEDGCAYTNLERYLNQLVE